VAVFDWVIERRVSSQKSSDQFNQKVRARIGEELIPANGETAMKKTRKGIQFLPNCLILQVALSSVLQRAD
jgi:hypothetical protein